MLERMKRISLAIALLVVVTSGCGRAPIVNTETTSEVPLPIHVTVESAEITDDGKMLLRGTKNDKSLRFVLDKDTKVYFDGPCYLTSIVPDQVVYLEGNSTTDIENVIITEWPGMKRANAVQVKTSPEDVPDMISSFLEQNYPELGVTTRSIWTLREDDYEDSWIYQFDSYLLSVRSDGFDHPAYTVMIMPNLDAQAIWSGRVNQYGEIEEYRYDQP